MRSRLIKLFIALCAAAWPLMASTAEHLEAVSSSQPNACHHARAPTHVACMALADGTHFWSGCNLKPLSVSILFQEFPRRARKWPVIVSEF